MFLLSVSWSFVISSPCTALCCPNSFASHFSWSPFVRHPPILKRCHITWWVLWGDRGLCLTVCTSSKCETPLWNVYIKPHAPFTSHTQCHFQRFPLSSWWKVSCVCASHPNAAAQRLPLVADEVGAGALQRLFSVSCLCSALIKLTQSVGAHCEVYSWFRTDPALWSCIQSLQILFGRQMVSHLSESLSRKHLLCLWF